MGGKYEYMKKMPGNKRPDYFVLHKVRYDEHGDQGHLEPFRSNLLYTVPRVFNPYPAIGESLSIYHFNWNGPASADLPHAIDLHDKVIVDRLNSSDLEDQEKHGYSFVPFVPGFFSSNRVVSATYPDGTAVTDGALGIAGTESFTVSVPRKKPLLVVLRTLHIDGKVQVSVNGAHVASMPPPTGKGWAEVTISVPETYLSPGQNLVEMRGTYMAAYYWFIQSADGN